MDATISKLTLQAFPSAGLIPPSPFDLEGNDNRQSKVGEKLDKSGNLCRKGGKRCVVEYININGVDEPFYSYVDDVDDEPPSTVEKSGYFPPPNDLLSLYE